MDKAPPPEALARVVRWIVMLFLAYALLSGGFHKYQPQKTPPHAPGATAANGNHDKDSDCASKNPLDNFSMMASALIPTFVPTIRVNDIRPGEGESAICGQKATFRYEYATTNGTVIFSDFKSAEPAHATIGDASLLRGLALGMIGMKPGGERSVTFPPAFGFERVRDPHDLLGTDRFALKKDAIAKSILTGRVALVSVSPPLPSSSLPLRIIDRQFSSGARAFCGDRVQVGMSIWKLDGTKIFSTQDSGNPLAFRIGGSQMAYGIEQAASGMGENAERTVILPPAYAKPLVGGGDSSADNPLNHITLPQETLLVEIRMEHIGDENIPSPQPKKMEKPQKEDSDDDKPDAKPTDSEQ